MPSLDELLSKTKKKIEKKKFSRGNRPDTMLRDSHNEVKTKGGATDLLLAEGQAHQLTQIAEPRSNLPLKDTDPISIQSLTTDTNGSTNKKNLVNLSDTQSCLPNAEPVSDNTLDQSTLKRTESPSVERKSQASPTHQSDDVFAKNEISLDPLLQPGTTRHNNPAQPGTTTRHNPTQISSLVEDLDETHSAMDSSNSKNQPGTTRHMLSACEYESFKYKDDPKQTSNLPNTITEPSISKTSAHVFHDANPEQLGTTTRHNPAQQPGTTQHNSAQNGVFLKNNGNQPGTTRHNPAPGPAQPGTTTRHNSAQISALIGPPSRTKQTHKKSSIESTDQLNNLSGASASILSFLCKTCLEEGSNRVTITYKMLSEITGIRFSTIPTTCKRLRNSGFFKLSGSKGGAQAVRHFDFSDKVIKAFAGEFLSSKQINIPYAQPGTTRHNNPAQPGTWAGTTASSKLVSNINTNLLTENHAVSESLSPSEAFDVNAINIAALGHFQITRKQIQDIKNQKLSFTTSTLQDFVDRFAIYASDSSNIRNVKSIPAIFVKMAQLASKGEDPLLDIETDTDRLIRERLERLKAKREERLKQQSELMELEFDAWLEELKPEGWNKLAPPTALMKSGSVSQKMILKNHFAEMIWPERASELGLF